MGKGGLGERKKNAHRAYCTKKKPETPKWIESYRQCDLYMWVLFSGCFRFDYNICTSWIGLLAFFSSPWQLTDTYLYTWEKRSTMRLSDSPKNITVTWSELKLLTFLFSSVHKPRCLGIKTEGFQPV